MKAYYCEVPVEFAGAEWVCEVAFYPATKHDEPYIELVSADLVVGGNKVYSLNDGELEELYEKFENELYEAAAFEASMEEIDDLNFLVSF
ncbi:MAG: hypothetical protein NC222_06855 [Staphylococcus sp.]|nr:hypothetical protein [Staphylococcus sp.]